jgi:hypothetical protein
MQVRISGPGDDRCRLMASSSCFPMVPWLEYGIPHERRQGRRLRLRWSAKHQSTAAVSSGVLLYEVQEFDKSQTTEPVTNPSLTQRAGAVKSQPRERWDFDSRAGETAPYPSVILASRGFDWLSQWNDPGQEKCWLVLCKRSLCWVVGDPKVWIH